MRIKLSKLNISQLKVLTLIALDFDKPLSGKEAQNKIDLSSAAITKALKVLDDEDFVGRGDNNQFKIIDPLFKSVLSQYERQNVVPHKHE